MTELQKLEYKNIVIPLDIVIPREYSNNPCDSIIAEKLSPYLTDGWQPLTPIDFDYLEENGYVTTQKKGLGKTIVANAIGFLLAAPFVSATEVICDSVTIPLYREVQD